MADRKVTGNTLLRILANFQELMMVAAIIFLYSMYQDFRHQERMEIVEEPLINDFVLVDFYQIDQNSDRKFRYLPLKITSVDANNISFMASNAGHSKKVGINSHVKFDAAMKYNYFNNQELVVSRNEYRKWLEAGIIYDIARPEKFYINGWIVLSPQEVVRGHELNTKFLSLQSSLPKQDTNSVEANSTSAVYPGKLQIDWANS